MFDRFPWLAVLILSLTPTIATAQPVGRLIGPEEIRQQGLERMWFTQIDLDRARGRLAGLHQHVSATEAQTIYEILFDGRRYVFSQRDRDAFGQMIGVEGAKLKADEKLAQIKGDLIAAGKGDTAAPAIEMRIVPEITLYASSERGLVHAIDGETGRTRWSTSVGTSRYPTTEPAANDQYVAVLNGSTLYVLKADDGSIVWTRIVAGAPGAGPAMTEDFVFVPMLGGAVETYLLEEPRRPAAVYKSFGRAMVQPVTSPNSVAWPTDRGNLYVSFANQPTMRFRLEARDRINAAPSFLGPDKIFAASMDGYVYCLNEGKGNVVWRFTTGDSISRTPVGLGDAVYAITDGGTLYCIGAGDGVERWLTTGISGYLAGNDERIYCSDLAGNLAVVDVKTGSRLGSIAAGALDLKFLNTQTDRIIVGSSTGLLQCLRETRLRWPVVHAAAETKKKVPQLKKPVNTGPAAAPAGGAPAVDPFAAPGAVDPFAAPPAAAVDPFAAPAPKPATPPAVDPFAP